MIVNSVEISDRWLSTSNGYPGPRVHVVLNGVESRIHEREHLRQQLRAELGISRSAILIGGAGHIFARKGFDALLRAFADAAVPNAHLAIVGDGDARQSLEKLAEDLQIANRTHWLGRRGNADEIIAGFDVFVLTSRNEGMANVMLEAMAAGAPVIALHVSGVETALAPTDDRPAAGWIVADEGALSSTIREVCTGLQIDPVAVNARTNEAHWRIENWFSKDRMIDQCEAILFR